MAHLNASYPRGLTSYIKTARELLADSKAGKNPFDGFTPSVSDQFPSSANYESCLKTWPSIEIGIKRLCFLPVVNFIENSKCIKPFYNAEILMQTLSFIHFGYKCVWHLVSIER